MAIKGPTMMPWGKYEQLCQDIRKKNGLLIRPVPPLKQFPNNLKVPEEPVPTIVCKLKKKSLSHTDSASLRKEMQINS